MHTPIGSGFRPPAPTPQPRPLGPLALLKALRTNPLECWTKAHFEEPIVLGRFSFVRYAVVSDPAAIRKILVEDQSAFRKSTIERRVLASRMPNGLVTVDGEQWQRLRRTLAPTFGRSMTGGFAPAIARVAATLVERWQNLSDGGVVEVKAEMSRVALEALVGCIFSEGLGDPKAVCDATTRYYATCGGLDPFDVLGLPDFVPRFTRLGVRHVLRAFYEALSAAISERRRSLAAEPNAPRDMLGAMLAAKDPQTGQQMTETEVNDNVMTLIFGGQETTSSALTWAIYLLSQSPEWRERVAKEADDVIGGRVQDAVDALVQTRAVVEEALRLYPPVIGITRTALRRTELAGHRIERGTMVVISPYVVHRHRLLWRDPEIFDPTRFLPGRSKTIERYTYLPFGVGPRMCIGAALAIQEATVVLATLMRRFVLELVPGQSVWPVIDFTMKPRDGLRMTVTGRPSRAESRTAE
jgi:cytochrome P450